MTIVEGLGLGEGGGEDRAHWSPEFCYAKILERETISLGKFGAYT
jgi:hypothetical protein